MTTTPKHISILGAGWLGAPLALQLKAQGHHIKVSTTTPEKVSDFTAADIPCSLLRLGADMDISALHSLLQGAEVLIITVPPGRNQQEVSDNYAAQLRGLILHIVQAGIKEVIFTSSTTVYLSLRGVVNEDVILQPVSDMDRQIFDIEHSLLTQPDFKATILRLGGLIGEDRHPVRYIVQRPVITEANNPVNMVHRSDIIRFISAMVQQPLPNEILNLVAPILSNRRDFYTQEAHSLSLSPLPEFTDNPDADMRRVDGSRIAERYGMDYEWLGSTVG